VLCELSVAIFNELIRQVEADVIPEVKLFIRVTRHVHLTDFSNE
jgi:hypothetical protein